MTVLAVPVINRPDLLARCIASIDLDVQLLIIDNGNVAEDVPDDAWVLDMPHNLGYPASVNLAIKCYPAEPFWLISNADVEYAPGDLARLCEATSEYGWVGLTDWRTFAITADTIERVGWLDENYHPAFVEDADYERRCTLAGIRWGFIPGGTTHERSVSLQEYGPDNARSYPSNVAYHQRKWGAGVRGPGGFTTPHDRGGAVADGTQPDLSRLRQNAWHHPDHRS